MRYLAVALPCFLLGLSVAQAADASRTSGSDTRLSEMVYDGNRVFQIKVKKNTATRIVLADDEHIISSATGFPSDCRREDSDWCVVANVGEHTLFVKPRARAEGANNLELTTDKRIYSLELVPVRDASGEMPMYRVTFRYQKPEPPAVPAAAQAGSNAAPPAVAYGGSLNPQNGYDSLELSLLQIFEQYIPSAYQVYPDPGIQLERKVSYDRSRPWTESLLAALANAGLGATIDTDRHAVFVKTRPAGLALH
jgi:type IV secretory pathway VirB9-like protein